MYVPRMADNIYMNIPILKIKNHITIRMYIQATIAAMFSDRSREE